MSKEEASPFDHSQDLGERILVQTGARSATYWTHTVHPWRVEFDVNAKVIRLWASENPSKQKGVDVRVTIPFDVAAQMVASMAQRLSDKE